MQSILGNTRKPDIVFSSSGRIDIAASVAGHLHLQSGDALDVMCEQGEFYLYVKHRAAFGRFEATAYRTNKKGRHFRASSKRLCTAILHECGAKHKARLCVGQPFDTAAYGVLLPIITKNPIM